MSKAQPVSTENETDIGRKSQRERKNRICDISYTHGCICLPKEQQTEHEVSVWTPGYSRNKLEPYKDRQCLCNYCHCQQRETNSVLQVS